MGRRQWMVSAFFVVIGVIFIVHNYLNVGDDSAINIDDICRCDTSFYHDHSGAVVMSIAPGTTISRERVSVRITNNTDFYYGYGYPFILETKVDYCWRRVPFINGNFILIGLGISPNSYVDEEKYLLGHFGNLPNGEYRIIKNITYRLSESERSSFQVMVEFTL